MARQQPQSRLLSIATEVRLTIWKFAIPSNERLILDPRNLTNRHPLRKGDYNGAASLLHTCKQASTEVLPLIYSRSTVTIVDPREEFDMFFRMSKVALRNITVLEICLEGRLKEASIMWEYLMSDLPILEHLKLNFYRSKKWFRDLARIAMHCEVARKISLKLELFESSWATSSTLPLDTEAIEYALFDAMNHQNLYEVRIPTGLKMITVAASVGPEAAAAFENYAYDSDDWVFFGDRSKDTAGCKHFVWYGDTIETKVDWLENELKTAQSNLGRLKFPPL